MIAAIVLLVTFGTLVAAGLPILTALFGLGISAAVSASSPRSWTCPTGRPRSPSMIGLGVGIDYALLILTRHRAAMARGREPRDAVVEAISTAGHSVLVAGHDGRHLAARAVPDGPQLPAGRCAVGELAVLVTMAASVTLLPALLGFAGRSRPAAHPGHRARRGRRPRRDARRPMEPRRAAPPVDRRARAAAALLVLATPFLGLRLGFPDAGNDRAATTTRQAYDLSPTASARARTARCCSPPSCTGRPTAPRRRAGGDAARRARRSPPSASRRSTPPATPRC